MDQIFAAPDCKTVMPACGIAIISIFIKQNLRIADPGDVCDDHENSFPVKSNLILGLGGCFFDVYVSFPVCMMPTTPRCMSLTSIRVEKGLRACWKFRLYMLLTSIRAEKGLRACRISLLHMLSTSIKAEKSLHTCWIFRLRALPTSIKVEKSLRACWKFHFGALSTSIKVKKQLTYLQKSHHLCINNKHQTPKLSSCLLSLSF